MRSAHRSGGGPPPEAFAFGAPAVPNQDDAGQVYTLGLTFTVSKAGVWVANDWFAPTQNPVGPSYAAIAYRNPFAAALTSKAFTPQNGVSQRIYFDSPQPVDVGITYTAAVLTQHYTFTTAAALGLPKDTTHIDIPAGNGWFNAGAVAALPAGGPTSNIYFVTPVIQF